MESASGYAPSLPSPMWGRGREEPVVHFNVVDPSDATGAPARPAHLCILSDGALAKCPSGAVSDDDDYVTIVEAAKELETSSHIIKQAIVDYDIKPKNIRYRRVFYFPEIEEALAKGAYPLSWVLRNDFLDLAHITYTSWEYVIKAGLAPEGRIFDGKVFYDPERAAEVTHASYTLSAKRAIAAKDNKKHAYHPPPRRWKARGYKLPATPSAHTLAEERGLLRLGQVAKALDLHRKQVERDAAAGLLGETERAGSVRYFSQESVALYAKRLTGYSIHGAARKLGRGAATVRRLMESGEITYERFNRRHIVIDCESVDAFIKGNKPSGRKAV